MSIIVYDEFLHCLYPQLIARPTCVKYFHLSQKLFTMKNFTFLILLLSTFSKIFCNNDESWKSSFDQCDDERGNLINETTRLDGEIESLGEQITKLKDKLKIYENPNSAIISTSTVATSTNSIKTDSNVPDVDNPAGVDHALGAVLGRGPSTVFSLALGLVASLIFLIILLCIGIVIIQRLLMSKNRKILELRSRTARPVVQPAVQPVSQPLNASPDLETGNFFNFYHFVTIIFRLSFCQKINFTCRLLI